MALAERMLAARFNRPGHEIVDHRTFVIASDGDLEEGISGEASSLAGHLGLGRLISFYDQNHISIEGDTKLAFTEDVGKRYEAYGWHVQDLEENIGLDNLERALETAIAVEDKPSLIIVRTHIAQGSPNKHDTAGAHGSPLGEEEVRLTKEHMGWPSLEPFFVPPEALEHFRRCVERGTELEADWRERFDAYAQAHPELADELTRMISRQLPDGWDRDVPRFHASGSMTATRKSSETVLQWAAANVPELVGGSADLAPSTLSLIADGGQRRGRLIRGTEPPLRDPRARDGRDRQRHDAPLPAGLRGHVLHVQRLHARLGPAGRADATAVDLRVHARLDRARRGRPDASADRAARRAAGDADAEGDPAGRGERDRAGVALRDQVRGSPDARWFCRARESRPGTRR